MPCEVHDPAVVRNRGVQQSYSLQAAEAGVTCCCSTPETESGRCYSLVKSFGSSWSVDIGTVLVYVAVILYGKNLRNEQEWQKLTVMTVKQGCLNQAGLLHFQVA